MRKVGKSKESKVVNNSLLNDPCIDQTSPWEYSHILVEFTLAILKPDVEAYHDDIEGIIHEKGFSIIHRRSIQMSEEQVLEFYGKNHDDTYLEDLIKFYSKGISRILLLARRNAIARWISIIGPENSFRAKETDPTSIRAVYGTDDLRNAVHGSKDSECAQKEISYFFADRSIEPLVDIKASANYLARTVNRTLIQGLKALSYKKPENPYSWLAEWLLEHSPYKPDVNPVNYYVQ